MTKDKKWVNSRRSEHYYKKAKDEGFASRAAYKLMQINAKFYVLPRQGCILDLGSAPGSWIEYVLEKSPKTSIIGVDLQHVRPPSSRVLFLKKDILGNDFIEAVRDAMAKIPASSIATVLSDAAPKFSGVKSIDLFRQYDLASRAVDCCKELSPDDKSQHGENDKLRVLVLQGAHVPQVFCTRHVTGIVKSIIARPGVPAAIHRSRASG